MLYPLTAERRAAVVELVVGRCGMTPTIADEQPVGHEWAPVTRLTFDRELPGLGSGGSSAESVIVKTRRVDGDGHGGGGPAFLRREVAGLRTAAESGVTAEAIAVDDRAGVVVQTDLGRWPTLESLLLGDDAGRASAAMVELGTAVGRLHVSTLGGGERHATALAEFGASDTWTGANLGSNGPRRWDEIESASADLAFPDARRARGEVATLVSLLDSPGPFSALVHHDLNPTNVLITDAGARLVDFEGCGFGHLGTDLSFLHYPFPHYSAHWAVLPRSGHPGRGPCIPRGDRLSGPTRDHARI